MGITKFGLPLLTREMLQQASRRSTYVYRMVVASGLMVVALLVLVEQWWFGGRSRNPLALLGHGRQLLEAVVYALFVGIYGLLPLLSCGAVTEERERNSLELLLLTRLGPWTIIFEKILSRVLLMTTLLLLSLPILAFSYSLGGITIDHLLSTVWLLFLASVHVITLAILASTICLRTVPAFLMTWAMGTATVLTPILLDEFRLVGIRHEERLFLPAVFELMTWRGSSIGSTPGAVIWFTMPTVIVSLIAVVLSRWCLTRPVPTAGPGRGKIILERIDSLVSRLLTALRKSPPVIDRRRDLPGMQPLSWKESVSGICGHPRYRRYVTAGLTLLVVVGCGLVAAEGGHTDEELACVYFLTTGSVALAVVARSATLFSSERSRQTLDILLVSPLTNQELLSQKFFGVRHWMRIWAVPVLVLIVSDCLIKKYQWEEWYNRPWVSGRHDYSFSAGLYLVSQVVTVWIYLHMLAWLSVLIGLKIRKPAAALMMSLGAIIAWALIPLIITVVAVELSGVSPRDGAAMFLLSSPFPYLLLNQVGGLYEMAGSPLTLFALNTLIYGSAMLVLRWLCFRRVGHLLQRVDTPVTDRGAARIPRERPV